MHDNAGGTGLSPCRPGLIQDVEVLVTLQRGPLLTVSFESHDKFASQKGNSRLLTIGKR